jgi:hypothetical protein
VENKDKIISGLTKKQMREAKRELKQIGNQQKRHREKAVLRDYLEGDLDDIPDFDVPIDIPTEGMNGMDRVADLKERWCKEKLDFCRPDGTNEDYQEVAKIISEELGAVSQSAGQHDVADQGPPGR